MKVKCYFEGDENASSYVIYNLSPDEAAQEFCDHNADGEERQHVVVVPLDGEARALPGWHVDMLGTTYKLFVVTPTTTWAALEVATFHTPTSASEPAPPPESR